MTEEIRNYLLSVADIFDDAVKELDCDDFKQLVKLVTMFIAGLQNEIKKVDGDKNGK